MHDIKAIRKEPDRFKIGLMNRGDDPAKIDRVLELDAKVRKMKGELDELRRQKKILTKQFYIEHVQGKD